MGSYQYKTLMIDYVRYILKKSAESKALRYPELNGKMKNIMLKNLSLIMVS